ncbi:TRAP transporter large permease subunit [Paralimibaculum aggregatum]|uniref:TRAP transporter large permease protein n=1 Tax=Paralimibaculum aggregatum TaxID=3036245 RepID=A0ABQ6LN12_9RHOB|nr:TRAP transporter large permease subunit [Limibaculum sp. NKW23]GMG84585.1 TRAP transporter large permease subunit [Limibaculum sp. NKW23]
MDIGTISLLIVAGISILLAIGVPLAFATGAVAMVTTLLAYGPNGLTIVASRSYTLVSEFVLVAVPMFILMASILEQSGVARDLFRAMHLVAGRLKGGLGLQTLAVAVVLAAMTGIIGGEIVLLGLIALPQMLARGYDRKLAIGIVCAGGSLGTMIPPSIVLVIYGLTANVSIGDLFVASLVPGLLLAGLYAAYVLIRCHLDPAAGPPAGIEERQIPLAEKLRLARGLVLPVLVIVWVLGTIYAGIASVSEAAAMGVIGAAASAVMRGEMTWAMLRGALWRTMSTSGLLIWLTIGANALIGVYNLLGGAKFIQSSITGLELDPLGVILLMMLVLIVLGLFIDWIGIVLLTMPIFVPIVESLGYSAVWFGVLFCMNMQISYLSPPFGPACFYLKSVAPPEIELGEIFRAMWPFIALQAIGLILVLLNPGIALWLPSVL